MRKLKKEFQNRGKAIVTGPIQEEFEEHMRTHIPFRNWCEFCVNGKSKNDPRKSSAGEERSLGEEGVPTVGIDYTFPRMEKDKRGTEEGMPIIVMKNSKDKWTSAFIVPQKGVCDYAVGAVSREIQNAGYNRVIFKSDQEPALKELLHAVK